MASSSSTSTQDTYLRIVVYCDALEKPYVLPDVRVPRRVDEVRRLVESRVGQQAKVISYWNYTNSRYEVLCDVRELLQADSRLSPRSTHTPGNGAAVAAAAAGEMDATTGTDRGVSSASELDAHHAKSCIFHCQLWMETVLTELEPLDAQRDRIEYDELRSHVACWLGNKHVSFELLDAVRIRCPFLTRMFDEVRSTRLSGNQDKVQLLYYSNNSGSVCDVLQSGFRLDNGAPASLTAKLQSTDSITAAPNGHTTRSGVSAPPAVGSASRAPSPPSGAEPTTANTHRTPFIFTSTMLSAHVKKCPAHTAPQKLLLCEVAPGRRFMTDQSLTGECHDKQAFPAVALTPPRGYDSVCFIRTHTQRSSPRPEGAAELPEEDLAIVQVQVHHSYQALPRYLLTVVPSATTPLLLQPCPTSVRAATATLVPAPGTTAQAVSERKDEKGTSHARRVSPPPPPPPPRSVSTPSKSPKMKGQCGSRPRQRSQSTGNDEMGRRHAFSAANPPQRTNDGGACAEWSYEDNSLSHRQGASTITPGGVRDTTSTRPGTGNQRHITWESKTPGCDPDTACRDDRRTQPTTPYRTATGGAEATLGRGQRMGWPWTSRAYSVGTGGSRNSSPFSNGAPCRGGRVSSVPSRLPTPNTSFFGSPASQLSASANMSMAAGGLPPSPPLGGFDPAHSLDSGVLYQGFPRGSSANRHGEAQPLVSSTHGSSARGRISGSVGAPQSAAPHSAPSRTPLLPTNAGAYFAGVMSGGAVVAPTQRSVFPTSSTAIPLSASTTAPSLHPPVSPAAFDQFKCGIHPRHLQSLYCTVCEELTCPYCASVGSHRTHVVVEAGEGATAVHAEAEALHKSLRDFLDQCNKMDRGLKAEQAHYTAQQQRDLQFVQQRFVALRQALHTAESAMMQRLQRAWCRPPLAETATVLQKYATAFIPIDAALRRYNSTVVASGGGFVGEGTGDSEGSLLELLHFLRTTPSLVDQVKDSFDGHKDDERRLHDAIADYKAGGQGRESFLQDVDWGGLCRLLESIGSVSSNEASIPASERSAPAESLYASGAASLPVHVTASSSVPSSGHSRSNSATAQFQSRARTAWASPHRDSKSDGLPQTMNSALMPACTPSVDCVSPSPPSWLRSTSSLTQKDHHLLRCLMDVRRGYVWVIGNATGYFAPKQRKAVCSTRFHLLGVPWELRIASLPHTHHCGGHAVSSPSVFSESAAGTVATAASRQKSLNSREGADINLKEINGGQAHALPGATHLLEEEDHAFPPEAAGLTPMMLEPSPGEGEEEWLGLFLFPLEHRLRMDFRVIAFSEVTWAEWEVTGWGANFAGKGWGFYPFLSRRELIQTHKLARDNTVKICIAPTSDLY
ncbi:hypothetical protein JKF63_02705 [Porcisia hertigi]|uniref:B box-type domain-containing protein n=1 Tax=Porcisia hertigi TaxID=2761500 RepID=A0A836LDT4_9TRYP|nr:hypothetical protein JKF63_02705 [Porcisia hertigi]